MTMMKKVRTNEGWLNEVNGCSVARMIEYLKELPQDHIVEIDAVADDDSGLGLESYLWHQVEMTRDEEFKERLSIFNIDLARLTATLRWREQLHHASTEDAREAVEAKKMQIRLLHAQFGRELPDGY